MLAAAGVNVPPGGIMASLDDALAFGAERVTVMKTTAAAHKTEEGGVMLNLTTEEDIRRAWQVLSPRGDVLVEEMITDAVAEVIVGIAVIRSYFHLVIGERCDDEMLKDTATLMLPASRRVIRSTLDGLKVSAF